MGLNFDVDGEVNVLESVKDAIAKADHLEETDVGAVANALAFAARVQSCIESDDPDRRDKILYGPSASLAKLLNDLGLTPQGKANLELDGPQEDDDEF